MFYRRRFGDGRIAVREIAADAGCAVRGCGVCGRRVSRVAAVRITGRWRGAPRRRHVSTAGTPAGRIGRSRSIGMRFVRMGAIRRRSA